VNVASVFIAVLNFSEFLYAPDAFWFFIIKYSHHFTYPLSRKWAEICGSYVPFTAKINKKQK